MRPIDRVIALWKIEILSGEEVVAWADREILGSECAPQELIDLSLYGPAKCTRNPEFEFPAGSVALPYATEFALRASALSLSSAESVMGFCRWCARAAMGEELQCPEVSFGYKVDHLLYDCGLEDEAAQYVHSELPKLLPFFSAVVAPYLAVDVLLNHSLEPARSLPSARHSPPLTLPPPSASRTPKSTS